MKFILKLLLAPLMLVLWIVEWALTLALKASAVVCVIASALFLLSGVFYFVDGNVQNGCVCLGIAFLLSPYGLHYLAVKLTARQIDLRTQYTLTLWLDSVQIRRTESAFVSWVYKLKYVLVLA